MHTKYSSEHRKIVNKSTSQNHIHVCTYEQSVNKVPDQASRSDTLGVSKKKRSNSRNNVQVELMVKKLFMGAAQEMPIRQIIISISLCPLRIETKRLMFP
ncbi:unnamed protein product [Acanthoscelides obtectus]|uniref:Uncharacterized protein n=1 Tax=Acanthoscelides obtectus TaxID=200917 RepID=A0A9P0JX45_ACAOB|nr:unnamed protein product [Acanthoscelides obtectus]CAK1632119.1 hypothetical protein AOBTE_LOCUS7376 [Acanthoscelides obtectus]